MKSNLIVLFCLLTGFQANAKEVLSALVLKKPVVFNLLIDEKGKPINPARGTIFHQNLEMRHQSCTITTMQLATHTNYNRVRRNLKPFTTLTLPAGTRFPVKSYSDRADTSYFLSGNVNETRIHSTLVLDANAEKGAEEVLLSIYCSQQGPADSSNQIPSLDTVLNELYVDMFSYETKQCFLICL